jgi:hypothetical protein
VFAIQSRQSKTVPDNRVHREHGLEVGEDEGKRNGWDLPQRPYAKMRTVGTSAIKGIGMKKNDSRLLFEIVERVMSLIRQMIEHIRIRYQSRCSRTSATNILLGVLSVGSRGCAVSIEEQKRRKGSEMVQ